jgi:hypothetical protein
LEDEIQQNIYKSNTIRAKLKELEQENAGIEQNLGTSAQVRIRKNLYQSVLRLFLQVVESLRLTQVNLEQKYRDQTKRQMKIGT